MTLRSNWARWARPLLVTTALALPALAQAQEFFALGDTTFNPLRVTEGTGVSRFVEAQLIVIGGGQTVSPAITGRVRTIEYGGSTGNPTARAGSACTAGVDYVALDQPFTVPTGARSGDVFFRVEVCGDATPELTEGLMLAIEFSPSSGGYCGELCAKLAFIQDDDTAPVAVTLSIADAAVAEPAFPGTRTVQLPVRLSAASSQEVRVQYRTVNGSAVGAAASLVCHLSCGDYVRASGVLVFAPGTTSRTIPLVINGDRLVEKPENFKVLLESPTGATLDDSSGVVTIGPPAVAMSAQPLEATALAQGKATPLVLRWSDQATPDGLALRLAGAAADAPFLRWNRDEGTLASCRASVVPRGSAALPVLDCAPAQRLGSPAGLPLGQGLRVQLAASRFSGLLDGEARAAGLATELTLVLSDSTPAAGGSVLIELARLGADGQLGAFSPLMPLERPTAATAGIR